MKVLFLDIDGVLNSRDFFKRRAKDSKWSALGDIDPVAAALVQRLCTEAGLHIVVSSTWRLIHKLPNLTSMLRACGMTAPIAGVTPGIPTNKGRGEEIQRWIDRHEGPELEGMVILDDDQDMLHLTEWLVRTPFETGFREHHILDAKMVIQLGMPPRRG